jgi:hypothetical protein
LLAWHPTQVCSVCVLQCVGRGGRQLTSRAADMTVRMCVCACACVCVNLLQAAVLARAHQQPLPSARHHAPSLPHHSGSMLCPSSLR